MKYPSRKIEKYCRNEYLEMFIQDGIQFGKYFQVVVDLKVAQQVFIDREKLCDGKKIPAIWDCRSIKYWTKEARLFQSSDQNYRLMKAGAVIYTQSHVATVVINFFYKFNPPPIPSKFFTCEEEALQWIQQFRCNKPML